MKTLIISFFSLIVYNTTLAQAPELAIAKVQYTFSHIRDTTVRDKPYREDMLLIIGKNASRYLSVDAINQKDNIERAVKEILIEKQGGDINSRLGTLREVNRDEYFYFTKENKLIVQKRLMNTYLIEEPDYTIDWNITNDTMSFEGIHCQKATAHFRGRNWIAWYATELPFQSGPWKLTGLPGLIISAHDDKNEVKFEFGGMEMIKNETDSKTDKNQSSNNNKELPEGLKAFTNDPFQDKIIKLPAYAIKTNRTEFNKLQEAMRKDPDGFFNTQLSGLSGRIKIDNSKVVKTDKAANKINNPIELPEK